MTENNWMEAIVHFRNPLEWDNKRKFALRFIKPTLEELWSLEAIVFFHYFFEPELRLGYIPRRITVKKSKPL